MGDVGCMYESAFGLIIIKDNPFGSVSFDPSEAEKLSDWLNEFIERRDAKGGDS